MMGAMGVDRIYGRNPVYEVLRAGRRKVFSIQIASGVDKSDSVDRILKEAKKAGIPVESIQRQKLDREYEHHQGVSASVEPYPYVTVYDLLERASELNEPPFLLVLDALQNPQNLGTLLRTAEAVGVHGVIIPPKRAAQVTHAVVSASAGACEHILIARENIARAVAQLKGAGVWVGGLEFRPEAQPLRSLDLGGPLAVIVGGEGGGMRRLVRESCDFLIKLPMRGKVDSLNAAVAGSICLYAAWERRGDNEFH